LLQATKIVWLIYAGCSANVCIISPALLPALLKLAEEIVEDVFVKLWSNRHRIHEVGNLTVYLYVAVKNRSLNAISQKANELIKAPFDDLDIETGPVVTDPYNQLVTAEMMKHMQQAVENLPARCKMIFKLVREDGLKHREVAAILNISINTVDVQMAIAIKKICTELQVDRSGKTLMTTMPQPKRS
jgi:RNA polymerase sigma-70 factor (family 1)